MTDIRPSRRTSTDYTLSDVLNAHKRDILITMNCHAIGEIESFDTAKQTATVKISYSMQIYENNNLVQKDYPILLDCPVMTYTGGGSGITMPIAQGDSCLVLFNDRDIDNWFQGGGSKILASGRVHSLSDAIIFVGIRPLDKVIQNYDGTNPTIFNGETQIKIKSSKILLENSSDKLGLLLAELIDTIKSITTTNCVVGSPVAVSPASQALLDIVKTKIEGLLE